MSDPELAELLPLNPPVFHILLSLSRSSRHGYAIMREVSERTDGRVELGPGTLYYSIQRMLEHDLIEELDEDNADDRRRTYRITSRGRAVAAAEAERLASLVDMAREARFLQDAGGAE